MDYIMENKEHYRNFISSQTVEEYTQNKRKDGVWGDSLEMSVFTQIFQINILIYFYDDFPSNILKPQSPDNNELLDWRQRIYQECIELDSSLEDRMLGFEEFRRENQETISFCLLYKNGNHYDALYTMSSDEYKETISHILSNVSLAYKV